MQRGVELLQEGEKSGVGTLNIGGRDTKPEKS